MHNLCSLFKGEVGKCEIHCLSAPIKNTKSYYFVTWDVSVFPRTVGRMERAWLDSRHLTAV